MGRRAETFNSEHLKPELLLFPGMMLISNLKIVLSNPRKKILSTELKIEPLTLSVVWFFSLLCCLLLTMVVVWGKPERLPSILRPPTAWGLKNLFSRFRRANKCQDPWISESYFSMTRIGWISSVVPDKRLPQSQILTNYLMEVSWNNSFHFIYIVSYNSFNLNKNQIINDPEGVTSTRDFRLKPPLTRGAGGIKRLKVLIFSICWFAWCKDFHQG